MDDAESDSLDDWARAVRDGYDDVAEAYDEDRNTAEEEPFVEALAADLDPGARLLDAGCGGGRGVLETLDGEYETVGLDLSRTQLALASERAASAALVGGDMTRLPFADDAFDALTSLHAVIHVPRDRHDRVFAEFARVCRPGARFLLALGNGAWEGKNGDWLDSGASMRWSFHGAEHNRDLIEDAGFTIDEEAVVGDELGGGDWRLFSGRLDR